MHIFWLNMHIYCIFLIRIFVHISCIFGTAYFVDISPCLILHIMAYLPLCIFKLISAYLHLLCLPRPISLINIQTAAGAQRQCCFFRQPIFLSFNRPHTRLKTPARSLADKGSADGRRRVSVLATSSCLFSSCNLDNWYWEHAPRQATMKIRCIRPCIWLFVVESTQGWL